MTELKFTSIKNNPTLAGLAEVVPDIVYAVRDDREYKLTLLLPQSAAQDENVRFPLIVFVQGSAWTTPDINYQLPQLARYAQSGYAVATIVHRSAVDGYKAPAFLEDTKCAIRFLRANAAKYHIDPERVGVWGTSSGGNTALLVGLTGDDPTYRTDEFVEQSDAVKTVVECFGPAEMESLFHLSIQPKTQEEIEAAGDSLKFRAALFGETEEEQRRRAALITPLDMAKPGKDYPPFLLIHGDADPVVPYDHSTRMAEKLCAADVHTEMIRVEGAEHEGTFWSSRLHDMILDYFDRTLRGEPMERSISKMCAAIAGILAENEPSIYLYGSVVLGDFRLGWSDIDILVLTKSGITEEQAERLVGLRQSMLASEPQNRYYRSFEGGMLSLDAFLSGAPDRVVYWGTSGQRITDRHGFDSFSMYELLESGRLLCGEDVRDKLTAPTFDELRRDVRSHYDTIRKYAKTTDRSLYSFGWLLDIARGIYTLRTGRVIAKTDAGVWALENRLCPDPDELSLAVELRRDPSRFDGATAERAETLGPAVQRFADLLERELAAC